MAGSAALCQQSSAGSNSPSQSAAPAPANGNAFPLAQSEAAAKAAQPKQQEPQTNAPAPQQNQKTPQTGEQTPQASQKSSKSSTARDNPFPEAQSKAAAKADSSSEQPSGGTKAASPSGYSSSDAHLPPPALGQGDFSSHTRQDTFTRDQTEDGRIADDLKVADLYMKNGDYRGALLRYQDTLQYDPQNDTALYGIAETMCKENLTAEAMARFKSYARNNPQGKYALKAEKMLAHPNRCMHNF